MKPKIWVGCKKFEGREVFRCSFTPTTKSHGRRFHYVIGPFRTMRGAKWMARYGENNPHCQTVDDAERSAKREALSDPCPSCGGTGGIGHCNKCNASGRVRKKKVKK